MRPSRPSKIPKFKSKSKFKAKLIKIVQNTEIII